MLLCLLTGLTVTCSIFTLAALSLDHYFTVKAPTRRSRQLDSGRRGAIITLVVIWVVSALLVGPILLVRHVQKVDLSIDQVSASMLRVIIDFSRLDEHQ